MQKLFTFIFMAALGAQVVALAFPNGREFFAKALLTLITQQNLFA